MINCNFLLRSMYSFITWHIFISFVHYTLLKIRCCLKINIIESVPSFLHPPPPIQCLFILTLPSCDQIQNLNCSKSIIISYSYYMAGPDEHTRGDRTGRGRVKEHGI